MLGMMTCDLTSALEDGSLGGVVIAIVWALWSWFHRHQSVKKSVYEK